MPLGWPVYKTSSELVPLKWITGRVKPGDVHTVFDYLCQRFNDEVEPIRKDWSWGWAYRKIRGSSKVSNHAKAIAIDLNAPAHPLGKRGTFSALQVLRIRSILRDLDGVVRWGGDYRTRKDEMHFEINVSPAALSKVAQKIKNQGGDEVVEKLKPGQDRIVTCNVAGWQSASRQLQAARTAASLGSLVALQEVEESQAALIAGKAGPGMKYVYPFLMDSRQWEVRDRQHRLLYPKTKGVTPFNHHAYKATFTHRKDGTVITLVAVHLLSGAWGNDPKQATKARQDAWKQSVARLKKFADETDGLVWLLGDFNHPGNYAIPGYRLLPSPPTFGKHARLDKHYIRAGWLRDTREAFTVPTTSDHRALAATYERSGLPMDKKVIREIAKETAQETVKELMRTNLWVKPDAKGQRTVRKLFQELARWLDRG